MRIWLRDSAEGFHSEMNPVPLPPEFPRPRRLRSPSLAAKAEQTGASAEGGAAYDSTVLLSARVVPIGSNAAVESDSRSALTDSRETLKETRSPSVLSTAKCAGWRPVRTAHSWSAADRFRRYGSVSRSP